MSLFFPNIDRLSTSRYYCSIVDGDEDGNLECAKCSLIRQRLLPELPLATAVGAVTVQLKQPCQCRSATPCSLRPVRNTPERRRRLRRRRAHGQTQTHANTEDTISLVLSKLGSFSMVYCYAYITDYKESNLALSIRPSTISAITH